MPVRPDELGDRIERYTKTLPQLHALRLCYRFGKGHDVHITKLPIEVEQAIEELVVKAWTSFDCKHYELLGEWRDQFACFESRCAPMDHLEDCNSPLSDGISDKYGPCDECEEDMYSGKCKNVCNDKTVKLLMRCESPEMKQPWELCSTSCRSVKTHTMNEDVLNWDSTRYTLRCSTSGRGELVRRAAVALQSMRG